MNKLLIVMVLATIFCSCEWEPTDVFEIIVNEDVLPPEIITLSDFENDTIFYGEGSSFNLNFNFQNIHAHKIYLTSIFLNDSLVYTSQSGSGTILFMNNQLSSGDNILSAEMITSSTSGSIADVLGAEGFHITLERQWILKKRKNYTYLIEFTVNNDYLNLTWPECLLPDFKEFRITGSEGFKGITSANHTIDSFYLGKSGSRGNDFLVEVVTQKGAVFSWAKGSMPNETYKLYSSLSQDGSYRVIWNRPRFYNSFDKWVLSNNPGLNSIHTIIYKETTDPNDTIYTVTDYPFGGNMTFYLVLIPKKQYSTYLNLDLLCMGAKSPSFKYFFPFGNDKYIVETGNSELKRYSIPGNEIVDEIKLPIELKSVFISPKGSYYTGEIDSRSIIVGKGNNLKDYKIHQFPHSNPLTCISDAGTGLVYDYTHRRLILYDYLNHIKLDSIAEDRLLAQNHTYLSSDGQYFTYTRWKSIYGDPHLFLFRFNNSIKEIATIPIHEVKLFRFSSVHPDQLLLLQNRHLTIRRCEDFAILAEYTLDVNDEFLDVDFYNNQVLIKNKNIIQVLEMDTWKEIYNMNYFGYSPCILRLFGNTIYDPRGIMRKFPSQP